MADSNESKPVVPVQRATKPVSEALLNEKWDRAISSMLIRSSLGLSFGVVFSVLLFKRRAWPAWVGLGFGAGRAWEEADCMSTHTWISDMWISKLLSAGVTRLSEMRCVGKEGHLQLSDYVRYLYSWKQR